MGAIRVTQGIMVGRVLNNLSAQQLRILDLQEQLSTGQKVNRPSDDPLAARRGVSARTEVAKNEQYLTNISTASPYLRETETSVSTVIDIVKRAFELTLQGGNGTNSQLQRDQIAIEVNQLIESTLEEVNHVTNGRYIFGGTRTLNRPYVETRDAQGEITSVAFEGNDGLIEVEVSEGVRSVINEPGERVFNDQANILQTLIDIRDNLRAGDVQSLTTRLTEIAGAQKQLLVSTARIGSVTERFERVDSNLRDIALQLAEVLSDNLDADYAEVIVNLNAQSNAFEASLNAAGRVIQPSLLDFIG